MKTTNAKIVVACAAITGLSSIVHLALGANDTGQRTCEYGVYSQGSWRKIDNCYPPTDKKMVDPNLSKTTTSDTMRCGHTAGSNFDCDKFIKPPSE